MRQSMRMVVGLGLAVVLWSLAAAPAKAQTSWGAPYCGGQPRITSFFDHEFPRLYPNDDNQIVRLYTGSDKYSCAPFSDGHEGWDFARRSGVQPCSLGERPGLARNLVFAVQNGTVRRSRWHGSDHERGYGLYIDLGHPGGMHSLYGHLAALFVEEGQSVARGQLIGALGTTGNSTGPHLHFHATRGDDATLVGWVFDVYGWCKDWQSCGCPSPGFPDPHRGDGWSERVICPGQFGPPCPGTCGVPEIVNDEDSSRVTFHCSGGRNCPHWYRAEGGAYGGYHYTYQNGRQKDYYALYRCPQCRPGNYLIEAYVPRGATAHVARYEASGRVTVMDQHAEFQDSAASGVWLPIGLFSFTGTPMVEVNDRTDRYDWGFSATRRYRIAADAMRFTQICSDVPPGGPLPGARPGEG